MVAVFDGDPKPIFEIILDPEAEEFVRSRMCEALWQCLCCAARLIVRQ
jgi:hypothetical protein